MKKVEIDIINDGYIFFNFSEKDVKQMKSVYKYARYILFKKDLYTKKYLDMWIEFLSKIRNLRVYYLDKPFPPFNPQDKIKIKK